MINSKKEKFSNTKDPISFDLISNRIDYLVKSLSNSIDHLLYEERKKVKLNTSKKIVNQFETEIQEIQAAYKNHLKKGPLTLESYLNTLHNRSRDLNDMLFKIKTYPIKSITNQLKKEAEVQEIEHTKIKTFVNELSNSIVNLVLEYTIQFEEYVMDQLCEREISRMGLDFYTGNIALKLINQQKYERYLTLLYKGIKAFYHDFKAFANTESPYFNLIEKFFLKLIDKIEKIACLNPTNTIQKGNQKKDFPPHIFKNFEAYQLFEELANHATNQEEIGFYFRQMSEKEAPRLIVAKEKVFRTWFNEEAEHKIELKNQIKTFDRIKGTSKKMNFYKLMRQKRVL